MKKDISDLYSSFIKHITTCSSEQDLREMFSQKVLSGIGITDEMVSHIKHEYSVINGRIDSLYGHVVLEFKAPGKLPKHNNGNDFIEYTEQIKRYISGIAKQHGSNPENILGVLFDGKRVAYEYLVNDKLIIKGPYDVDKYQFSKLVNSIFYGLTAPKAMSSRNLIADFGLKSILCNELINLLYEQALNTQHERSKLLFSQWKVYFREICGYEFESKKIYGEL
jgi:hypothetical protein